MSNKTRIKFTRDGIGYKVGDTGYIDGYITGRYGNPCAIVIKDNDNKFILVPLDSIIKI